MLMNMEGNLFSTFVDDIVKGKNKLYDFQTLSLEKSLL